MLPFSLLLCGNWKGNQTATRGASDLFGSKRVSDSLCLHRTIIWGVDRSEWGSAVREGVLVQTLTLLASGPELMHEGLNALSFLVENLLYDVRCNLFPAFVIQAATIRLPCIQTVPMLQPSP